MNRCFKCDKDVGNYQVTQVVAVDANWHPHKAKAVVEETQLIESLPFQDNKLKRAALLATSDP